MRVYLFLHPQEQTGQLSEEDTAESIPIQLKTISLKACRSWNAEQTREQRSVIIRINKQLMMLKWNRKVVAIKKTNTKERKNPETLCLY